MTPVSNRPAGDYASGDDTLNIAPSKLVAINNQIVALVPQLGFDVGGSFCLREGVVLSGSPGRPPQVQASIQGSSRPADLGDDNAGGSDGALYGFLFGHDTHQYAELPCFMHVYINGPGVETPVNVRVFLRALAAANSIADLKDIIVKYSPEENVTNIETRWPWVVKAVQDAFAAEKSQIQQILGGLDGPVVTGMPFQIMGPVTQLGQAFGNGLKASVSVNGGPAIDLAVRPDNPPTIWKGADDVTAALAAQGVDAGQLLAAMQKAVS